MAKFTHQGTILKLYYYASNNFHSSFQHQLHYFIDSFIIITAGILGIKGEKT